MALNHDYYFIQTIVMVVTADNGNNPIDLSKMGGVIDFSMTNPTGSGADVTPIINSIPAETLTPGSPMLMLGGYHNSIRKDLITFEFVGGTGKVICYFNKRVSPAHCLI